MAMSEIWLGRPRGLRAEHAAGWVGGWVSADPPCASLQLIGCSCMPLGRLHMMGLPVQARPSQRQPSCGKQAPSAARRV